MNRSREEYLTVAKTAAGMAGEFLLSRFGGLKEMTEKETDHFGIAEDKQSNDIYEMYLKKETPEVGLYTEEGERDLSRELVWIVDSIEGTSNYRVGIPYFATQICLIDNGKPIVSVVNAVPMKTMFWAVAGVGTFRNGEKVRIGKENLSRGLVAVEKGRGNNFNQTAVVEFSKRARTVRWFGATGLSLAYTASGAIDLFLNKGSQLYDMAPGVLLVQEAGGVALDLSGNNWEINSKEIVAGNETIVKEALEFISS